MIDNQKNLNFEYTPLETEFLNNSDNNIYSPKKDRLISKEVQESFSIDEDNYDNLEYEKEIAAIEKKTKNNILFQINTLESLRISKDDSTTLYEQINGKKEEEKLETPNKKNVLDLKNNYNFNYKINDNNKKNLFGNKNHDKNKNINNNKFNIEKDLNIDFKKELEKNLKEIFEKKGKLYKLKFNHLHNHNNTNNNTIKNKNNNSFNKKNLNDSNQQITNYNNYFNNTIQKKTLNNLDNKEKISNSSSKISCNTTIKKSNKTKCIYQIKKNNIPIQKKPNKRKVSTEKIIYQNISNSMTNTTNCSTTRKNNDKINMNNINVREFSPKPPIKNKKFIPHSGIKIQKPIAYFSHNYSYRNVYRAQTELNNNNNNKENINTSNYNNFYNNYNNNNNLCYTSRLSKKSNSLKEKRKISLKKNESNLSINFEKKNKLKKYNKTTKKNINLSTSKHENKYKLFTKDILLLSNKNSNNNNNACKKELYKNNIKNITIAPISSITSKLFIRNNNNNKCLSYKCIENSFNNYKNKLNYLIKTDRFGKKKMNLINNGKNNSTKNSFHTITYN